MENIAKFLEKFMGLAAPNEKPRRMIVEVIENLLGSKLEMKDVSIKENIAYIKGGSHLRSEIFLNKEKILEAIRERTAKDEEVIIGIR